MPVISVIVPVYKVEPYLRKCVDSILNQTFADFDFVLVDDGSPDDCGRICDECAVQDNRIHVIHQKNGGLSAARNAGIDWAMENSPSKFLCFVDSDDWVDEHYLEMLLAGIKKGAEISCTSFRRITSDEKTNQPYLDLGWQVAIPDEYWKITDCMKDCAWAKLYPKSFFRSVRYPEGRLFEDIFTTFKLIFQAKKIAFRDCATYNYLDRTGSITQSTWSPRQLDMLDAYDAQISWLENKGHASVAEHVRNRARSFAWSAIEHLRTIDTARADKIHAEILSDLSGDKGLGFFWENRGIFKQTMPLRARLLWPLAMSRNTLTQHRSSWLVREFLPILRQMRTASAK